MQGPRKSHARRWSWALRVLIVVAVLGALTAAIVVTSDQALGRSGDKPLPTVQGVIEPSEPGTYAAPDPATLEAVRAKHLQIRENLASKVDNTPESPEGLETPIGEPTTAAVATEATEFHNPTALQIGRNEINTVNLAGTGQSVSEVAEPALANVGKQVFYTGNWFASYTKNVQAASPTWTSRPFPAAPGGEVFCCDEDVEYDQARDRVLWIILYITPNVTHGTVGLAVSKNPTSAPQCIYYMSYGTEILPDYPHVGLSNDFVYVATNNIDTQGTASSADDTWAGAVMRRLNLDSVADCSSAAFSDFTFGPGAPATGQRVFVPVEGVEDNMYFGLLDDLTTFRIYEWPETAAGPTATTRAITSSAHVNPDCRGGTNNLDWLEGSTSWSITGFRMRGWYGQPNGGGGQDVVGWLWNASPTGGATQAHVRAAVFDADSLTLLSQPHIFNNATCFGYPDVAATERGHPAIVVAHGGNAGGGGGAANSVDAAVLLGDDTSAALGGGPFGSFFDVATGTHMPASQRWGDYFTIQQHEPCDNYLVASPYVLNGGTGGANVDYHYVAFGRGRDTPCFDHWKKK